MKVSKEGLAVVGLGNGNSFAYKEGQFCRVNRDGETYKFDRTPEPRADLLPLNGKDVVVLKPGAETLQLAGREFTLYADGRYNFDRRNDFELTADREGRATLSFNDSGDSFKFYNGRFTELVRDGATFDLTSRTATEQRQRFEELLKQK